MNEKEYANLYEIIRLTEEWGQKGVLPLGQIEKLLNSRMRIQIIPPNTRIFSGGQLGGCVYFIIRGSYFNYRISPGGKMHILGRESAPQWLGIDRAVNMGNVNLTENKTLEECVVLKIQASWFVEAIRNNGDFAVYIIRKVLSKMTDISGKSDRLLFQDAREHLIFYILKYWNENHGSKDVCRIAMKNALIAEELGINIRTLYRAQSALKEEGLITVKKGDIVVTSEQIEKMTDTFDT